MSGNNITKKGYNAANNIADKGRYNFEESFDDLKSYRKQLRSYEKEKGKKLLEDAYEKLNNHIASEDRNSNKDLTLFTVLSLLNILISLIGGGAVYKTLKDTPVFEKTNGYYSGHSSGTHSGNGSGNMDAYNLVSTLINAYHEKATVHFDATTSSGEINGADLVLANDWNHTGKIISSLNASNSKLYFNFDGVTSADGNGSFVLTGAALKQFLGGLKFNYSRDAVVDYDTGAVPLQGHADLDFSGIEEGRQYIVDLQGLSLDGSLEGHCEMDASRSALEILASPLAPKGNVSITYDVPSMDGKISLTFNQTEWAYIKTASQLVNTFSYNGSDDSAMSGTTEINGKLSDPLCFVAGLLTSLGAYNALNTGVISILTKRGQTRQKHTSTNIRTKMFKFISDITKLHARHTEKHVSATDAAVVAILSSGTDAPTQKIDGEGLQDVAVKETRDISEKTFSEEDEDGWAIESMEKPNEKPAPIQEDTAPVYTEKDITSDKEPIGSDELAPSESGNITLQVAQKPVQKSKYDTRPWAEKWSNKKDDASIEQKLDNGLQKPDEGSSAFDEQPDVSD